MAILKTKHLIWFTALALIMACVPTFAAPAAPTIDPNAISTYIAQTANAAATQTAAAMPSLTSTPLFTATPRNTDTPEPTATSTVIFLFYTPSPVILVTQPSGSGTGNASSKPYACEVLSVTPANGTALGSRTDFDAKWKVKNIGRKEWDHNSVDYVYLTGDKFHKVAGYDLGKSVKTGETRELIVDMLAPKSAGTYTTNWTLRVGSETFCTLSLTIVVN